MIKAGLRNPVVIAVKEKGVAASQSRTPSSLENFYMVCEPRNKLSVLVQLLKERTKVRRPDK